MKNRTKDACSKKGFAAMVTALFMAICMCSTGFAMDLGDINLGKIDLSGCIEIEVGFEDNGVDDEDSSDISLATAEVGLEATPTDWLTGFVLFSWDDDEEEMIFDEAHITLGGSDSIPYYLQAGKLYLPFGVYETNMISDPLTLDLGETVDNAIQVGVDMGGVSAAAYIFNGDSDEVDEDDAIRCFGASLAYEYSSDTFSLAVGADWMNNLFESDGLIDVAEDHSGIVDYVDGYALHTLACMGPVAFMAEYVAASDDISFADKTEIDAPAAWALELGYTVELAGKETTFALGYQGSEDAVDILPESKLLCSVGMGFNDYFSAAVEYATAEDYDTSDGGSGEDVDTVTLQLALEF
ncbi:porin [Desulfocicer vacuolatum DSM 3385]|uniref:Porin n=1 Tax=Desulfocicer vacuolatum DSM 3385 TaxID=1121400 RepID=A0A1W1YTW1_9BACT|nr:LbtU family siderophore porin [Desulfocicer vacuolatum]SMC39553.1 porin [Desulfocicer vacuolatum DSM 3385]